ncbi:MAG: hypothetical protein AB7U95_37520 [Reyranella sp.]
MNTATSIETLPEVRAAVEEIASLETFAATYQVTTPEQYQRGAEDLKRVKAAQKRLEETRTSLTKPINESLRRLNDFFRSPADRLVVIERAIKGALTRFADEQERLRREEQRKADEAARREREALAEKQRQAEEKAKAEQERLRREAAEAEAAGRAAEAAKLAAKAEKVEERTAAKVEALQIQEAAVVAPVISREPPKVAGLATREVWKFRVVNAALVPDQYKAIDEARIRKVVAALKGDANIPGVEVYSERTLAAGAA